MKVWLLDLVSLHCQLIRGSCLLGTSAGVGRLRDYMSLAVFSSEIFMYGHPVDTSQKLRSLFKENKPICYSVQLGTFYSLQLLIYNLKLVFASFHKIYFLGESLGWFAVNH